MRKRAWYLPYALLLALCAASAMGSQTKKRGLDLPKPSDVHPARAPAAPEPAPKAPPPAPPEQVAPEIQASPAAAQFVFDELRRVRTCDDPLIRHATESLRSMGDIGVAAARARLAEDHPAVLLASARLLLTSSDSRDAELVKNRLRGRVPSLGAEALVQTLCELSPVLASPAFLLELLDHPQTGVRKASFRYLREELGTQLLPELLDLAQSERSDTRLRIVQLLADIEEPRAAELLLEFLSDRSSNVAGEAVRVLAEREDEGLTASLADMAFGRPWILREEAYAVLALIEREDARREVILNEVHTSALVGGLRSSDPFVAGTCAAALAGIGFRSRALEDAAWLDKEVPLQLVLAVSGRQFHTDYGSLRRTAMRRLSLISGESFADNGPAWLEWWDKSSRDFRAHRIHLEVTEESLPSFAIEYGDGSGAQPMTVLLVSENATPPREGAWGGSERTETLRLSPIQTRELVEMLRKEGIFGPERLPGTSRAVDGKRMLRVMVGGRSKSFEIGPKDQEPWFERAAAAVIDLRDRNRWQHFSDPTRFASAEEFWIQERDFWDGEHSELERSQRLKEYVLASLRASHGPERDKSIEELRSLYAREGVAEAADFPLLIEVLRGELVFSSRVGELVELALQAAKAAGGAAAATASDEPDSREPVAESGIAPELAEDLCTALARFGSDAESALSRIVAAAGKPFARRAALNEHAELRIAAASVLAAGMSGESSEGKMAADTAEDMALLERLLADRDPEVEVAAVRALGENRVQKAQPELLVRARISSPKVRAAALEAVGKLGGEGVLDALVAALADAEPLVQEAAALGLGSLRDEKTSSILVSLLVRGRDSRVFEPAREGLLALSEAAWPDLLRGMSSSAPHSKRECALVLAHQGVPESAPVLISVLSEDPRDELVAAELAVLTCVDCRVETDPALAWWDWWDLVVHEDSLPWLCAALGRAGIAVSPSALSGQGTRAGARALLAALECKESFVAERARRELSRLLKREVKLPSLDEAESETRLSELSLEIDASFR